MNPLSKLAAYAAVLVVVLALGLGLGRVVGPIDVGDEPAPAADADRTDHGHDS